MNTDTLSCTKQLSFTSETPSLLPGGGKDQCPLVSLLFSSGISGISKPQEFLWCYGWGRRAMWSGSSLIHAAGSLFLSDLQSWPRQGHS